MKKLQLLVLTLGLAVCTNATGATVGVSINTPVITNDFVGKVSISITGLSTGKTVLVERFNDVNGNGAIDAGQDALTFSFTVTDGQVPLIGGVRNLNVPGDDDGAANGAIRVDLQVPNVDSVFSTASGKFIFRVSDPQSGFSPVTAVFEVRQKIQLQGVSGQITAATGGAPLAGAFVLLSDTSGQPFAATVTDASGNYSFYSPAGTFSVFAVRNGFVTDFAAGGAVVVASQFATRNLALASGGFTISGKVSDASTSAGVAGIFVLGESTDNLFSGGLTDANGNYTFSVTASQWKIKPEEAQLAQVGFISPQNVTTNTTSSGSATINFAAPKANALIYGTVKDNLNNAVNSLGVQASDQTNLRGPGVTFTPNGNYSVGVLAGSWFVSPDSNSLAARGLAGGTGSNVTVSAGQAVQANFVVQGYTARLRGRIQDNTGLGLANFPLVVQQQPLSGGGNGSVNWFTDALGNFDVGVFGGTWNIALECVTAYSSNLVTFSKDYVVVDGVDQSGIVLTALRSTAQINGSVRTTGAVGISNIQVYASTTINGTNYVAGCTSSDASGSFVLKILNGTWNVNLDNYALNGRGFASPNSQSVTITGANGTANFVVSAYANTAPTLSQPGYFGPGQFFLQSSGEAGRNYALEFSTTLTTWTPLTTNYFNSSANNTIADTNAPTTFRFYRLRLVP